MVAEETQRTVGPFLEIQMPALLDDLAVGAARGEVELVRQVEGRTGDDVAARHVRQAPLAAEAERDVLGPHGLPVRTRQCRAVEEEVSVLGRRKRDLHGGLPFVQDDAREHEVACAVFAVRREDRLAGVAVQHARPVGELAVLRDCKRVRHAVCVGDGDRRKRGALRVAGRQKEVEMAARLGTAVQKRDDGGSRLDRAVAETDTLITAVRRRIRCLHVDADEVALRVRERHALRHGGVDERRDVERNLSRRRRARSQDAELRPDRHRLARLQVKPPVAPAIGAHDERTTPVNRLDARRVLRVDAPERKAVREVEVFLTARALDGDVRPGDFRIEPTHVVRRGKPDEETSVALRRERERGLVPHIKGPGLAVRRLPLGPVGLADGRRQAERRLAVLRRRPDPGAREVVHRRHGAVVPALGPDGRRHRLRIVLRDVPRLGLAFAAAGAVAVLRLERTVRLDLVHPREVADVLDVVVEMSALRRPDADELRGVSRNLDLVAVFEKPLLALAPQVTHAPRTAHAKPLEAHLDPTRFIGQVEDAHRDGAVRHRLGPHLVAPAVRTLDTGRAEAERILVDVQHLVVREERPREVAHLRHVVADHQRRGEETPHRDVRVLFVRRQAVPALRPDRLEHEHVRVAPRARARVHPVDALGVHRAADVRPAVEDVARETPRVRVDLLGVALPAARKRVVDVAVLFPERLAHHEPRVEPVHGRTSETDGPARAEVVLQVVESPGGVLPRVAPLVHPAPFAAATRLRSRRGVDADLEPQRVDMVREGLHVGEARVEEDVSVRVAHRPRQVLEAGLPALLLVAFPIVVDDEVLPAVFDEAKAEHRLRLGAHVRVGDVRRKAVPAVPAHRRREADPVADHEREGTPCDALGVLRRHRQRIVAFPHGRRAAQHGRRRVEPRPLGKPLDRHGKRFLAAHRHAVEEDLARADAVEGRSVDARPPIGRRRENAQLRRERRGALLHLRAVLHHKLRLAQVGADAVVRSPRIRDLDPDDLHAGKVDLHLPRRLAGADFARRGEQPFVAPDVQHGPGVPVGARVEAERHLEATAFPTGEEVAENRVLHEQTDAVLVREATDRERRVAHAAFRARPGLPGRFRKGVDVQLLQPDNGLPDSGHTRPPAHDVVPDGGDLGLRETQRLLHVGGDLLGHRPAGIGLEPRDERRECVLRRRARPPPQTEDARERGQLVVDRKVRLRDAAQALDKVRERPRAVGAAPAVEVDRIVPARGEDAQRLCILVRRGERAQIGPERHAHEADAQGRDVGMWTFRGRAQVEIRPDPQLFAHRAQSRLRHAQTVETLLADLFDGEAVRFRAPEDTPGRQTVPPADVAHVAHARHVVPADPPLRHGTVGRRCRRVEERIDERVRQTKPIPRRVEPPCLEQIRLRAFWRRRMRHGRVVRRSGSNQSQRGQHPHQQRPQQRETCVSCHRHAFLVLWAQCSTFPPPAIIRLRRNERAHAWLFVRHASGESPVAALNARQNVGTLR